MSPATSEDTARDPAVRPAGPPVWDGFVSYSRDDKRITRAIEKSLSRYQPPRDLRSDRKHLRVFRDESDLIGSDYFEAVEDHLRRARKLLVFCSPSARKSEFVNDEIARFLRFHEPQALIPILVRGKPDNEAEYEDERAFPAALTEAVQMPLAIDYRGFGSQRGDRVSSGRFESAWYSILARLLDQPRENVEQREKRRRQTIRRRIAALTGVIVLALSVTTAIALWQRSVAIDRLAVAESRRLAAQAMSQFESDIGRGLLLALESGHRAPTLDARRALLAGLDYHPHLAALFKDREEGITSLAFSQDGNRIVYSTRRRTITRDVATGEKLAEKEGGTGGPALARLPSPDGTSALSWLSKRPMLSVHQEGVRHQISLAEGDAVGVAAWRADSGAFAVGTRSGRIVVVELPDFAQRVFEGHRGDIRSLTYSPDGSMLASASCESWEMRGLYVCTRAELRFWNTRSGEQLGKPSADHVGNVVLAFSPDNAFLATAGGAGRMAFWDAKGARRWGSAFQAHDQQIRHLAFSPDGNTLASGSGSFNDSRGDVRLWDLMRGFPLGAPLSIGRFPPCLALDHSGNLLAVCWERKVRLWNLTSRPPSFEELDTKVTDGSLAAIALSADGSALALAICPGAMCRGEAEVRVWDLSTEKMFAAQLRGPLYSVALSPDGSLLAAAGSGGSVWEVSAAGLTPVLQFDSGRTVAIGPYRQIAVHTSSSVRSWNLDDDRAPQDLFENSLSIFGAALGASPSGDLLAIGEDSMSFLSARIDEWTPSAVPVSGGRRPGSTGVFSADVSRFAGTWLPMRWDSLALHRESGGDTSFGLWDVKTGIAIGEPMPVHGKLKSLASSGNGHRVATATYHGPLYVWNLEPGDLRERACRVANRNLTCDEWQTYFGDADYVETCPGKPGCKTGLAQD